MSFTSLLRRPASVPTQIGLVLLGVAAVLLGLELVYLIAANLVLRSSLIQNAVAGGEGLHLEFGSAYSLLPGRAHVRGLLLRVEDYNVQFQLSIERAEVDIGLDELLRKRFHCYRVRAEGVSFLMRHKVNEASGHGERLQYFPKIAGFSDPPLYRGAHPPPIPDSEYDLWELQVDNVVAQAKELWFLEYRFRGDAEARGSFVVRPARLVRVDPATLDVRSGKLEVGAAPVARKVTGRIDMSLPALDVPHTEGAAVFELISTQVWLSLRDGDLGFLNAYREPGAPEVSGNSEVSVRARVEKGIVQPETEIVAMAKAASVSIPGEGNRGFAFDGAATLEAEVTHDHPGRFAWTLESERLSLKRSDELGARLPAPVLERTRLRGVVEPTDLGKNLKLTGAYLSVPNARIVNLYWLEPWLGAGGKLRMDGRATASAELSCNAEKHCWLDRARVDANGARLGIDDRASEPFAATISAGHVALPLAPDTALDGEVKVQARPASALLPLVTSLPIKDALSSMLDLKDVRGVLLLSGTTRDHRLALHEAESGKLRARGAYRGGPAGERGALLLSTPLVNFGVTLRDGETSVKPLVSDDWLTTQKVSPAVR